MKFVGVGAAVGEDLAFAEEFEHGVLANRAGLPCSNYALEFLGGEAFDAEVRIEADGLVEGIG
jgi:hypothetical protein